MTIRKIINQKICYKNSNKILCVEFDGTVHRSIIKGSKDTIREFISFYADGSIFYHKGKYLHRDDGSAIILDYGETFGDAKWSCLRGGLNITWVNL